MHQQEEFSKLSACMCFTIRQLCNFDKNNKNEATFKFLHAVFQSKQKLMKNKRKTLLRQTLNTHIYDLIDLQRNEKKKKKGFGSSPSPQHLCVGPQCSGRSVPWPAEQRGTAAG